MLDLRFIRENLEAVRENCANRNLEIDLDRLVELDELRRSLIAEQQSVRERHNELSKTMKGRKPSEGERELGKELKQTSADLDQRLQSALDGARRAARSGTQHGAPRRAGRSWGGAQPGAAPLE